MTELKKFLLSKKSVFISCCKAWWGGFSHSSQMFFVYFLLFFQATRMPNFAIMDSSSVFWLVLLWSNIVVPVTKSSLESCLCHLHNVTLALKDKSLQLVELSLDHNYDNSGSIANVSRCYGGCGDSEEDKSRLVCRPGATALKTVTFSVPWNL